jgi:hypothetical protein
MRLRRCSIYSRFERKYIARLSKQYLRSREFFPRSASLISVGPAFAMRPPSSQERQSTEAVMTDVITGTFQVAKSRVSWASTQVAMIAVGACLLLTVLSYIMITHLPLDPVELAGETIWVRP